MAKHGKAEAMTVPTTAWPTAAAKWRKCVGRQGLQSLLIFAFAVGYLSGIFGCNTAPPPSFEAAPDATARSVLTLPPDERLNARGSPVIALSPDGAHLVYSSSGSGSRQLYLRALGSLESKPIPGTEGASSPFFSPDGQWLGFFADRQLKKVSIGGGAPVTLCDTLSPSGVSWGSDTIVFGRGPIWQVSAEGGIPQSLTRLETGEASHAWPDFLPGGKGVLFTVFGPGLETPQIGVYGLETGEWRVLVKEGVYPRYLPTGHLVYAWAGSLLAVPFDLARLEVTGNPVSIVEGVAQSVSGVAHYSVSSSGSLVYVPGGIHGTKRRPVWVDRQGTEQFLAAPPGRYVQLQLSPDGQRLALQIDSPNSDVWIYDIADETLTRLTSEGGEFPIWTPDGKRITFSSDRAAVPNLFWKPADGSSAAEQLTTSEHPVDHSFAWSPDGQVLTFTETHPTTGWDIWLLRLQGELKPQPFLRTPFQECCAVFSPDGRWLAYASNDSGRPEIYAQPFPGPGEKRKISTEGGIQPVWAGNGKELFYWNRGQMMAVDITTDPTFGAGQPRLLFEGPYVSSNSTWRQKYDVTSDGQRFAMIKRDSQELGATELNVVLNWAEELKRLVR